MVMPVWSIAGVGGQVFQAQIAANRQVVQMVGNCASGAMAFVDVAALERRLFHLGRLRTFRRVYADNRFVGGAGYCPGVCSPFAGC